MKKILAFTLSIITFLSFSITTFANYTTERACDAVGFYLDDTFKLGDANLDKKVDAKDVFAVKSFVVGKETVISTDASDIDADNAVSARDAFYIKASFVDVVNLSDFENGYGIQNATIAGNPIEDYEIVLNEDFVYNADNATGAAEILRRYVRVATGVTLSDNIGTKSKPHMIRIACMDPLAPADERMNLGIEDYIYEVKDGDLYIYGTLRGCMYAVYEILEEYFGFRFAVPTKNFEYKLRAVDIPEGTRAEHKTRLTFRFVGAVTTTENLTSYYYANRLNATYISGGCDRRYGLQTGSLFDNAHSFVSTYQIQLGYQIMLEEGYTDEQIRSDLWSCFSRGINACAESGWKKCGHDWQPCASDFSEGSDYDMMFKGMLLGFDLAAKNYPVKYLDQLGVYQISFSINDNGNSCTCRTCTAKVKGGVLYGRTENAVLQYANEYGGHYTVENDPKATASKRYSITFDKEYIVGLYMDITNKAAREVKDYMPNSTVWTIIYDFSTPTSIRPGENVSVMYCGHGCIQHVLGSGECGDGETVLHTNNASSEFGMKWWSEQIHAEGGQIWFWDYAVNYTYYFLSTPNIIDMWQKYNFILNECDFDGFYHEGQRVQYNFEILKSYLSAKLQWNQYMSYDEFINTLKEFLYIYYGEGCEELYQYILMQQEAGDATGYCFITNHDRPFDMYSWQYLDAHYEEMRALLESALSKADTKERKERVQFLIYSCDFMGLSSAYSRLYKNGSSEDRNLFETRMTELYNYFDRTGLSISDEDVYSLPDELDFSVNPVRLFYDFGAWRPELNPPS